MYAFTNYSTRVGCDTRSVIMRSSTGRNSEYSFLEASCHAKVKEPSLPYYLSIAGRRIIGFVPFLRV